MVTAFGTKFAVGDRVRIMPVKATSQKYWGEEGTVQSDLRANGSISIALPPDGKLRAFQVTELERMELAPAEFHVGDRVRVCKINRLNNSLWGKEFEVVDISLLSKGQVSIRTGEKSTWGISVTELELVEKALDLTVPTPSSPPPEVERPDILKAFPVGSRIVSESDSRDDSYGEVTKHLTSSLIEITWENGNAGCFHWDLIDEMRIRKVRGRSPAGSAKPEEAIAPIFPVPRRAFRYFGGKWEIAPWIIKSFPLHTQYIEPFGGAWSVGLRKSSAELEVYNDLDERSVNFFKQLQQNPDQLIEAIERSPRTRDEFELCKQQSADQIEQARRYYLYCTLSVPGGGGDGRSGTSAARIDLKAVKDDSHLWAVFQRIQCIQIESLDAIACIKKYDSPEALFYVDPPYLINSRGSVGKRGRKHYLHEMTELQHRELAAVLKSAQGMVVVSGYASELYDELFSGWSRIERKTISSSRSESIEVLWVKTEADCTTAIATVPTEIIPGDEEQLDWLEEEIDQGLQQVEAGKAKIWQAVSEIQRHQLWRVAGYDSFETYCKNRWGWERSNAYEVAQAGEITAELIESGIPDSELPTSVSQTRALSKVEAEKRPDVLRAAIAATGGKPTAKAIRAAAKSGIPDSGKPTENLDHAESPEQAEADLTIDLSSYPEQSDQLLCPLNPKQCWFDLRGSPTAGQMVAVLVNWPTLKVSAVLVNHKTGQTQIPVSQIYLMPGDNQNDA